MMSFNKFTPPLRTNALLGVSPSLIYACTQWQAKMTQVNPWYMRVNTTAGKKDWCQSSSLQEPESRILILHNWTYRLHIRDPSTRLTLCPAVAGVSCVTLFIKVHTLVNSFLRLRWDAPKCMDSWRHRILCRRAGISPKQAAPMVLGFCKSTRFVHK